MKKNTLILVALFSLSAFEAMAQEASEYLDSLLAIWEDPSQTDSVRVESYSSFIYNGFLFTKTDSAFELAEELHRYAKTHNYPKAIGRGYNMQGLVYQVQGNYPRSLEYHEKSLAIREELGDKQGISASQGNIGNIYFSQGNYSRALEYHEKSLVIKEEIEDNKGIAITLNNIGNIYSDQGNYPRALEYHEKAMAIQEELGDNKGIAHSLHVFGNIYLYQGNYHRALECYERSLAIREELGIKKDIANILNNIGNIYSNQGNYPRALEYHEKSLAIKEELGDKMGIGISLNNIGTIYHGLGNTSSALEHFERAMKIREEIGDKKGIAASLGNIGVTYRDLGHLHKAMENYEKTLAIQEEIGDKRGIARSLYNIGIIYKIQNKAAVALDYCQKSLALAEDVGLLEQQKLSLQCLYDTYKIMGKGNEALVHLEKLRVVEDSMQAEETNKKLQQMEFNKVMLQDSLAKAEEARLVQEAHQAEVRKKNKVRNVFMGSSLFLLLIAGGLYSRWRIVRKSRDTISKEKDRSEILLLNILPAEIAAELKEKGRADARDFDLVSILFTDFKEFTRASEKLSAQELVSEINACFEAFDAICDRYQIEKIKTIGDAYMAAGGLPVPSDDSVENTVRAALEMQVFINLRKAENEAAGLPAFEMRVGVHTGPVVAGIVGVKKFQYDIWGDTVNTAARMESSGEVGKVNISEATYELVKDQFECTYRGEVEAKGKGKLGMYFVNEHTIS